MPTAIFLAPMQGSGVEGDRSRGKYTNWPDHAQLPAPHLTSAGTIRSGGTTGAPALICLTTTQDYLTSVAAQPDTLELATEASLDEPVPPACVQALASWCDQHGMPTTLVEAGATRRRLIRRLASLFQRLQRVEQEGEALPLATLVEKSRHETTTPVFMGHGVAI